MRHPRTRGDRRHLEALHARAKRATYHREKSDMTNPADYCLTAQNREAARVRAASLASYVRAPMHVIAPGPRGACWYAAAGTDGLSDGAAVVETVTPADAPAILAAAATQSQPQEGR